MQLDYSKKIEKAWLLEVSLCSPTSLNAIKKLKFSLFLEKRREGIGDLENRQPQEADIVILPVPCKK